MLDNSLGAESLKALAAHNNFLYVTLCFSESTFLDLRLPSSCFCRQPLRLPVLFRTPPLRTNSIVTMGAKEDAVALKNKGNDAFKAHDWPTALEFYTKAIETYDKEPSFYTNRAQVCSLAAAHDHLLTWFTRPT